MRANRECGTQAGWLVPGVALVRSGDEQREADDHDVDPALGIAREPANHDDRRVRASAIRAVGAGLNDGAGPALDGGLDARPRLRLVAMTTLTERGLGIDDQAE
jgi:hypothetical protein